MTERTVLRVGVTIPVDDLDPRRSLESTATVMQAQIFEPPADVPVGQRDHIGWMPIFDGPLEPDPASPDTWVATLQPNRRFSDGTRVTSEIVVESLRGSAVLDGLATMAVDGPSVRFTTSSPDRLKAALSQRTCSIVLPRDGALLGTGPFCVVESGGGRTRLGRNRFWPGYTDLEGIEIICIPPEEDGGHMAMVEALNAGDIDLTLALDRDEVSGLGDMKVLFQPGRSTAFLACNMDRPFFRDVDLRRAVSCCVDRLRLSELAFEDADTLAARGLLPRQLGEMWDDQRHDLEAARAHVRRASERLPDTLRMLCVWAPRPYLPRPRRMAETIATELGALGVRVHILYPDDPAEYMHHLVESDYDLALAGWMAESDDVAEFLSAILSSEAIPAADAGRGDTCNVARWSDADLDRSIEALRGSGASDALRDIEARLRDGAPVTPLIYGPEVVAHAWRVRNFQPGPIPSFAGVQLA